MKQITSILDFPQKLPYNLLLVCLIELDMKCFITECVYKTNMMFHAYYINETLKDINKQALKQCITSFLIFY